VRSLPFPACKLTFAQLGLRTSEASWTDVFGFDDDLLAMVPQPCLATVLLFPVSDAYEAHRREQAERIKDGQEGSVDDLIFIKQVRATWRHLLSSPSPSADHR
jgi:hypothetical protein